MTLDPKDWSAFRKAAHDMLDASLDKLENAREGKVWTPVTESLAKKLKEPLPMGPMDYEQISDSLKEIMPYGPGNIHPRFFGWVNGAGSPSNILAEMAGASMNVNAGSRNHVAPHIEQQVIRWMAEIMGMPKDTSGLVLTGTSMATIVALKAARDFHDKKHETTNPDACMVGYASEQAHSCIGRAFDMLGICKDNLRKIKCNENYEMDLDALKAEIEKDRAFCHIPFAIIGSAGTVNTGAIDDLDGIADICEAQNLWFHVDGAFGATAILAKQAKARLKALSRVDSLAFDFHKWWQVNYGAGCVLVRDPLLHRQAFARRPEYLRGKERGLAGGDFWAVDYGPELSRSFRALKVWTHIKTHGINAIKDVVERNIEQAQYLESIVKKSPKLEMLAPVPLNICCFRYKFETDSNSKNSEIVVNLQEDGIAAPSSTTVNDKLAIRVNLTNHRTVDQDLDILIDAVIKLGDRMTNKRA